MKSSGGYLYAFACILVPVAWGLLMVGVVTAIERTLARRRPRDDSRVVGDGEAASSPEYYI